MEPEKHLEREIPPKPRIFLDADVLFAGAASPNEHSVSNLLLRMSELPLIDAITNPGDHRSGAQPAKQDA
jgi:hypothetical protein